MQISKKIAFALTPLLLIWSVAEAVLWLAGFEPPIDTSDPYVGFAGEMPLFEDVDVDGVAYRSTALNKLAFFNDQEFPADKAPGSRRVFCLGGSTTYGRPYDDETSFCRWLLESLVLVAPQTNWEVINAGGISYASYRVVALMQDLVREEPDLFVVYTGHNEFLEERTYAAIRDRSPLLRKAEMLMSRSRFYGAIESAVHRFQLRAGGSARSGDGGDQLAAEVETRLESSVGLDAYRRDDGLRAAVEEHFRVNLDRMVDIAAEAEVELVLVVPADNLSDCSPFKSEPPGALSLEERAAFDELLRTAEKAFHASDLETARAGFLAALQIDPRHAHARYGLGRVLRETGDHRSARAAFVAARNEDVCPLRALTSIVDAVRETARTRGVPLLDFPEVLREREGGDPDFAPGADWFLDHVHPTIDGHRLLARHLLSEVHALGWLPEDPTASLRAIDENERVVLAQLDSREHGRALRNLAKVLSWAGKIEDAARAARGAVSALGGDDESFFVLAEFASLRGDHEEAVAYLREAIRLDPSWAKAHNNLGVELMRLGRSEAALEAYDEALRMDAAHSSAHFNRANCLRALGRLSEAADDFRRVLRRDPDDLDALFNLAGVYEEMGEVGKAQRSLRRVLALDPDDTEAAARLARLDVRTQTS